MIGEGSYAGSEASLDLHATAIGHILELSRENGIDSAYPECMSEHFRRAIDAGHGQDELPALFEVLREKADPPL